jgi:dTDP-4-amino-4,6-dideoxygalactose transaminase
MAGMIPFFNLNALHQDYLQELFDDAKTVISSGNFILGTEAFEDDFSKYVGTRHVTCVASGTAALHLALKALGVGPGDEVITVGYTFRATVSSILYVGATPVYVDIDPKTFCMDVEQVAQKITNRTKCIIPVHLFGNAVDMVRLMEIANFYDIPVVEDASQAHGTTINDRHVGTFGKIGTFSFYPSKNLGALGDAGCVVTDDEDLHVKLKEMRNWQLGDVGHNYRMDNIQSAFLRTKLKYYPKILENKRAIANEYNKYFDAIHTKSGVDHSYNVYTILVNDRENFVKKICNTVQTRTYYDKPVSAQSPYIFSQQHELKYTNELSTKQLSLPIYPGLDLDIVIETLRKQGYDNIRTVL